MNEYDHEDAFKDANICAGKLTRLSEVIKSAKDTDQALLIIFDAQEKYENIFKAFIEGVDYGRKNSLKKVSNA